MNRSDFYPGGQEISTEDLTFIQSAIRDGMAWNNGLYSDNYVVKGAVFSGSAGAGWSLTAGTVVLGGEIFQVDAATYPAGAFISPSFVVVQTTAKQKTNKDGTLRNVRLQRKATVASNITDGVPIHRMDNVWRKVGDDNGATSLLNSFTHNADAPVQYRRMGNKVELRGMAEVSPDVSASTSIFQLPGIVPISGISNDYDLVGFRPSRTYRLPVVYNTGAAVMRLFVDNSGNVGIQGAISPTLSNINLDGVFFYLD